MSKVVVSINLGNFGSTGVIMRCISKKAQDNGLLAYQAYPGDKRNRAYRENDIILCSELQKKIAQKLAYYTGLNGCFCVLSTIKFVRKLNRICPDIIHLHNLHNSYINLPIFFSYIKKHHIQVVWTLHDCWAVTGQCPYFTMIECNKWEEGCYDCGQLNIYPAAKLDRTKMMWGMKKKWFSGIENLTIVTPSQWLADIVRRSFLSEYNLEVINNGIDLTVFKPQKSDFREKYNCKDKYLLLGVAFDWGKRKGLDIFIELSKFLSAEYQIILVGTDEKIDEQLPQNIISIHRTQNQKELAEIYTAADLFLNPTREDNYPTVNMEALACGTPVITFNTGGSPECIDSTCGVVVERDDVFTLKDTIIRICSQSPFSNETCTKKAMDFDMNTKFEEYIELYERLL